ncbi:unnamed protein product [Mycena citricolor]|uniref:Fungal-type protein kinase domain-containing protein n=1 Tax=Mycena citricolor TaxID=2018698 RepID=A0AAD2JYF3_9AGAR|nr:unnamed protein product [Mycena citricolor]
MSAFGITIRSADLYKSLPELAVQLELEVAHVEEDRTTLPFKAHLKALAEANGCTTQDSAACLDQYYGYSNTKKVWVAIKKAGKSRKEVDLYAPLVAAMTAIMERFDNLKKATASGDIERRAVRSCNVEMPHNANDATNVKGLRSEPGITILGVGPSATKDRAIAPQPKYSQVVSLCEVKVAPTFLDEQQQQIAVYARETFIKQPHRRLVYATLITGDTVRVCRYDRSGCYYSQEIDYHEDAVFFVQLVFLLTSTDEELVGFDTSIFWRDGKRFLSFVPEETWDFTERKWRPNKESATITFALEDDPVFSRRTIRSRGTVCWVGTHDGEEYLIKDYWRAEGRTSESIFLYDLAGIEGVAQMFAWQRDIKATHTGRGGVAVTLRYAGTLETTASLREFLGTRSIVRGHKAALVEKGILHRDINFANLLLSGRPGAHSVTIDWDMAVYIKDMQCRVVTEEDARTGTTAYQSVKVLSMVDKIQTSRPTPSSGRRGRSRIAPDCFQHWDYYNANSAFSKIKFVIKTYLWPTILRWPGFEEEADAVLKALAQFFCTACIDCRSRLCYESQSCPVTHISAQQAVKEYDQIIAILTEGIDNLPESVESTIPPGTPRLVKRGRPIEDQDEGKLDDDSPGPPQRTASWLVQPCDPKNTVPI